MVYILYIYIYIDNHRDAVVVQFDGYGIERGKKV